MIAASIVLALCFATPKIVIYDNLTDQHRAEIVAEWDAQDQSLSEESIAKKVQAKFKAMDLILSKDDIIRVVNEKRVGAKKELSVDEVPEAVKKFIAAEWYSRDMLRKPDQIRASRIQSLVRTRHKLNLSADTVISVVEEYDAKKREEKEAEPQPEPVQSPAKESAPRPSPKEFEITTETRYDRFDKLTFHSCEIESPKFKGHMRILFCVDDKGKSTETISISMTLYNPEERWNSSFPTFPIRSNVTALSNNEKIFDQEGNADVNFGKNDFYSESLQANIKTSELAKAFMSSEKSMDIRFHRTELHFGHETMEELKKFLMKDPTFAKIIEAGK